MPSKITHRLLGQTVSSDPYLFPAPHYPNKRTSYTLQDCKVVQTATEAVLLRREKVKRKETSLFSPRIHIMEAVKEDPQSAIDHQLLKKHGSVKAPSASSTSCFDCNICLDFAAEPVVTLCGHLYCWPCIYMWLNQTGNGIQQCPVCKASLSQNALIPLYGRGHNSYKGLHIPRRPPSTHRVGRQPESPMNAYREQQPVSPFRMQADAPMPHYTPANWGLLGATVMAVLPWVFRNREQEANMHYPSPFGGVGMNTVRARRREMEVEMSLHQIWVFLCCGAVLCLLFF